MNLFNDTEKLVEILLAHIENGNALVEIRKILDGAQVTANETITLVNAIKAVLNK